jgi:hypothetical protein
LKEELLSHWAIVDGSNATFACAVSLIVTPALGMIDQEDRCKEGLVKKIKAYTFVGRRKESTAELCLVW